MQLKIPRSAAERLAEGEAVTLEVVDNESTVLPSEYTLVPQDK